MRVPRLKNSLALDFFIDMKRFNVRLPELSLVLVVLSFEPGAVEMIGEPAPIVNGECGRRQPFDHCGLFIGDLPGRVPIFVGGDFVPGNDKGT